jgi:hypothetical protein
MGSDDEMERRRDKAYKKVKIRREVAAGAVYLPETLELGSF